MANPYKLYIQQIEFDGSTYTKGKPIDTLEKFNVVCEECPFVLFPERKDLPTRDWADQHGLDAYIPSVLPIKEYDLDVKFLYKRTRDGSNVTDDTVRTEIKNFIKFLYGRVGSGVTGDTVMNPRLAIYSEDTGIGRKDVVISKVGNKIFFHTDYDDDVVADFEVKFTVMDPVTDVTPSYVTVGGVDVLNYLTW